MFEDLQEESVDVTPDSPDRTIAYAIWARSEENNLTAEEAWAILHERYPDDPRFLLLNAYAEIGETKKQSEGRVKAARAVDGKTTTAAGEVAVWSAAYFLKKVDRVLSTVATPIATDNTLHPHIRDLLIFGGAILAKATADETKTLNELRARLVSGEGEEQQQPPATIKRDDRDRAGLRLRRFEREVLKELDERTEGGKPLGVRAPAPTSSPGGSSGNDWASMIASATDKPRRKYAADTRVERGELIEHSKFGLGIVTGTEPGKAVILFESGVRKLVAAS
jgi:hypothetical protein